MDQEIMLKEAERLHSLGLCVHWLKGGLDGKRPVEGEWNALPRYDWPTLKKKYRKGNNLGVRTGSVSRLSDGRYLANIDMDIKSPEKRHHREAREKLLEVFEERILEAPSVESSRGRRYFIATKEPVQGFKVYTSPDRVIVRRPSVKATDKNTEGLSPKEIQEGYRISIAWEIELIAEGKQVVLPPSIHPDTGERYEWRECFERPEQLPTYSLGFLKDLDSEKKKWTSADPFGDTEPSKGKFIPVSPLPDLSRLSDEIQKDIFEGHDSEAVYRVCLAMVRANYSDDEITTILTDKYFSIGEVAYEHMGNSKSRDKAAHWIRSGRRNLPKAKREIGSGGTVEAAESGDPKLSKSDSKKQLQAIQARGNWKERLKRLPVKKGSPPGTLGRLEAIAENVALILEHEISRQVIKRDDFRELDVYGADTPWAKAGEEITDRHISIIQRHMSENWGFEPHDKKIENAIVTIAEKNHFNPVIDNFNALGKWDGKKRLPTLLGKYFGCREREDYLRILMPTLMVGCITRVYHPGTQFDWALVIGGPQGLGKTNFIKAIFGEDYVKKVKQDLSRADAAMALQGALCIEIEEMSPVKTNSIESVKTFISDRKDNIRPPYGRRFIELKRRNIFIGTADTDQYLNDPAGNRRFNPVVAHQKITEEKFAEIAAVKDQLWAEALQYYKNQDYKLYLPDDIEEYAKGLRDQRMVGSLTNAMLEALVDGIRSDFMTNKGTLRINLRKFRMRDLFTPVTGYLSSWRGNDQVEIQHAGLALRKLNCTLRNVRGLGYWEFPEDVSEKGVMEFLENHFRVEGE